MYRIVTLLLIITFQTARSQEVLADPAQAFTAAGRSGKNVLLIFSGSDWCLPCIHLEKTVLTDSSFRQWAAGRLILLEADFPQRKKIPDTLRSQYESLAEQFNAEGSFPKIVLLDAKRHLLAYLLYNRQSPAEFIRLLNGSLPGEVSGGQ